MQTDMVTVPRDTPLAELERLLAEHRVGGLPVTDAAGHLVGIVSFRDLIERYAQDPDARPGRRTLGFTAAVDEDEWSGSPSFEIPIDSGDTVGDIMTGEIHAVSVDTPVAAIAAKMIERRVHRVLVTEKKHFVGLITTFDLLQALTQRGPT